MPFSLQRMPLLWISPTSSLVTIAGPIGANVSNVCEPNDFYSFFQSTQYSKSQSRVTVLLLAIPFPSTIDHRCALIASLARLRREQRYNPLRSPEHPFVIPCRRKAGEYSQNILGYTRQTEGEENENSRATFLRFCQLRCTSRLQNQVPTIQKK